MKLYLLLLFAMNAFAGSITLSCPDASIVSNGPNYSIVCGGLPPTPAPAPPPAPPVTPGPPGPPPTICGGAPVRTDFPKPGSSPPFTSQLGVINSWKLPASSGMVASTTEFPGTPQGLVVEWAISKCPGDFDYYKSDAAKITTPRGQRVIVCGGTGGQSAGVSWGRLNSCVITGGDWYINLRYLSGGSPNTNYTITMGLAL